MALDNIGAKLIKSWLPKAGKAANGAADKVAERAIKPDLLALDRQAIDGLNRNAVKFVADLNAPLREKNAEALSIKLANMAKSPARFLTGQPELMQYDMRNITHSMGAPTVVSGDMHLRNLGTVLKRNGAVRHRFNDFDEATIAPAAVDFNRMATHIVLEARGKGLGKGKIQSLVEKFGASYYDTLSKLAANPGEKVKVKAPSVIKDEVKRATKRDYGSWIDRLAPEKHGQRALHRNSYTSSVSPDTLKSVTSALQDYHKSLPADGQKLLAGYKVSDVTSVLSGTGSMGETRFHVLLEGPGKKDVPIVLQLKEQSTSAVDLYTPPLINYPSDALRNVAISHVMDGGLDPLRGAATVAGVKNPMLVEHLVPQHVGTDLGVMKDLGDFKDLIKFDGAQAAKAHARGAEAGLASAQDILSTLPPREQFISSLVNFSQKYADQTEKDHAALVKALRHDPTLAHVGS